MPTQAPSARRISFFERSVALVRFERVRELVPERFQQPFGRVAVDVDDVVLVNPALRAVVERTVEKRNANVPAGHRVHAAHGAHQILFRLGKLFFLNLRAHGFVAGKIPVARTGGEREGGIGKRASGNGLAAFFRGARLRRIVRDPVGESLGVSVETLRRFEQRARRLINVGEAFFAAQHPGNRARGEPQVVRRAAQRIELRLIAQQRRTQGFEHVPAPRYRIGVRVRNAAGSVRFVLRRLVDLFAGGRAEIAAAVRGFDKQSKRVRRSGGILLLHAGFFPFGGELRARNRGFRVGVQNLSKRRVAVAARKKFFESFGDVRVLRRNLVAERRRQVRGNVHVRRRFAKLRPDRHPLRELAESRGRNITRFRSAGHRSRFFLAETPVSCSIPLVRFGIGSAFGHFKIAAILSEVRALPKRLFVLITPQLHGMSGAHIVKISVFGLLQINQHAGSGVR